MEKTRDNWNGTQRAVGKRDPAAGFSRSGSRSGLDRGTVGRIYISRRAGPTQPTTDPSPFRGRLGQGGAGVGTEGRGL